MGLKPCLGVDGVPCGRLSTGSRCPQHRRQVDAARGSPADRGYGSGWRALVAAKIAAEPWCHRPGGCRFPSDAGTAANPLSGQHIVALALGGSNDPGNVAVWCLKDNSADVAAIKRAIQAR